jgi:hypothetical protein
MSTRALYTFIDPEFKDVPPINIYKHHDGYPDGAADHIEAALKYAWELPRFEADEFAAAFCAATKVAGLEAVKDYPHMRGGGTRVLPSGDPKLIAPKYCSDIEYRYEITAKGGKLYVKAYSVNCWGVKCKQKLLYKGSDLVALAQCESGGRDV